MKEYRKQWHTFKKKKVNTESQHDFVFPSYARAIDFFKTGLKYQISPVRTLLVLSIATSLLLVRIFTDWTFKTLFCLFTSKVLNYKSHIPEGFFYVIRYTFKDSLLNFRRSCYVNIFFELGQNFFHFLFERNRKQIVFLHLPYKVSKMFRNYILQI